MDWGASAPLSLPGSGAWQRAAQATDHGLQDTRIVIKNNGRHRGLTRINVPENESSHSFPVPDECRRWRLRTHNPIAPAPAPDEPRGSSRGENGAGVQN